MYATLETARVPSMPGLRRTAHVLREMRRDGIRMSTRRRPAQLDTGDFVIAHPLGQGRWLLGVGDAMGRGSAAEQLAAETRTFLRARAARAASLGDLLRGANHLVHSLADGERFVSLLLMLLDARNHTLRIANAGQCEPLAVGRSGGVIALEGHGPALGLLSSVDYHEAGPLRLPSGVLVLATTDGVTEALDARGRMFGRQGVARSLAAARSDGPRGAVRRVLDDADAHAAGGPSRRDIATTVAFRFER